MKRTTLLRAIFGALVALTLGGCIFPYWEDEGGRRHRDGGGGYHEEHHHEEGWH